MNKLRIRDINLGKVSKGEYSLSGWVKTHRQSKNVSFIELTDGTSIKGLQVVLEPDNQSYAAIASEITTGCAISVQGELIDSPAKGQKYEFQASEIALLGRADADYPLQKKGHSFEFLREICHLRPRSNSLGAVFRLRSVAAMAVHQFFQDKGFYYLTSPIITTSDCEGAGELFKVTALDLENLPQTDQGKVDYSKDFFKSEAGLTVSGQLEGEAFATALGCIYTFGPTFRAENSNTARHLSEFWMIEPEMAFYDLHDNMELAEEFIKYLINYVLEHCAEEMEFFEKWIEKGLVESVRKVADSKFEYMEYTQAVEILENCNENFEFPVSWGMDLQSEHERYLTEKHIDGPLFVVNYPKQIKPFYMRVNDDQKTVRAMDMLVPRVGELIGGSQREERHNHLVQRMQELDVPDHDLWWYLELRKYGTVPHAGFGLGFERFLMYITGMKNIRDVIPFPRHPGFAKF